MQLDLSVEKLCEKEFARLASCGLRKNIITCYFDFSMGRAHKGEIDRILGGLADGRWRRLMDDDMPD